MIEKYLALTWFYDSYQGNSQTVSLFEYDEIILLVLGLLFINIAPNFVVNELTFDAAVSYSKSKPSEQLMLCC